MIVDLAYSIGLMLMAFVAMYFLMVRPENKKKKALQEMRNELQAGDVVLTIGGIMGTVCHVKEESLILEVGEDRVRLEVTKWAISTRATQNTEGELADKMR